MDYDFFLFKKYVFNMSLLHSCQIINFLWENKYLAKTIYPLCLQLRSYHCGVAPASPSRIIKKSWFTVCAVHFNFLPVATIANGHFIT